MAAAGRRMHAVCYESYGKGAAGLKHKEVGVPSPSKDEVLIKVEAVSLNPVEWKYQKGVARPFLPRKFPHIPCTDVAGDVIQVGADVTTFKSGDKVVAIIGQAVGGGLAEFAVAKAVQTVLRPPEVSADDAAGLPIAGLTAHQALTGPARLNLDGTLNPTVMMNILVIAASGGVGHYAVQLAKLGNAHVTATCGARNLDFVRSLGADEVLDYKTAEGKSLQSPSGKKYDVVINCAVAAGIPWSTFDRNLSENGKVIELSPKPSIFCNYALKKLTLSKKQVVPMFCTPKADNLKFLVKLVKEGKLKTVIDSKHPLSRAQDGWARSIDGHATGKIIINP